MWTSHVNDICILENEYGIFLYLKKCNPQDSEEHVDQHEVDCQNERHKEKWPEDTRNKTKALTWITHQNNSINFNAIGVVWLSWWRHQMETFSTLLALFVGNSPVTGEFPAQRPVTRSFGVSCDLRLNKRLSKQSWGWWFEMPSRPYCRSLRCSWSIACRRCSNYIFILDLTPGFKGFGKDSGKTLRDSFKCWDLVRLILETWRYTLNNIQFC